MFYMFSKVLWALLQPSSLLILSLFFGALLVRRGLVDSGLRWIVGSLTAMLIIGVSSAADLLAVPLENRFPRREVPNEPIAGIIVLGGAEDLGAIGRELMPFNEAGERLTEAVSLAHALVDAKLVYSGHRMAIGLLQSLGVPPGRIVLEEQSRSTYENALYTRDLLKPRPDQRWILVTSAWHMPRSIGCFRQAGFDVMAWPVDHRTAGHVKATQLFQSFPEGLRRFDTMAKEIVGLVAYRLTGRIAELYPSPE